MISFTIWEQPQTTTVSGLMGTARAREQHMSKDAVTTLHTLYQIQAQLVQDSSSKWVSWWPTTRCCYCLMLCSCLMALRS